jgi:cytochrome P450
VILLAAAAATAGAQTPKMLSMLKHQPRCVPRLSFLRCSLLHPPQRKRGLLEQLNLSADTFETQRSILQGSPAARAPYMFVDTVLVGSADLARELLMNDSGAYVVDFPPHMLHILGEHSMGTTPEPEHTQVRRLQQSPPGIRYQHHWQWVSAHHCHFIAKASEGVPLLLLPDFLIPSFTDSVPAQT